MVVQSVANKQVYKKSAGPEVHFQSPASSRNDEALGLKKASLLNIYICSMYVSMMTSYLFIKEMLQLFSY